MWMYYFSIGVVSPADLLLPVLRGRTLSGRGCCVYVPKSSWVFRRLYLLLLFRVVCENGSPPQ